METIGIHGSRGGKGPCSDSGPGQDRTEGDQGGGGQRQKGCRAGLAGGITDSKMDLFKSEV